MKRKSKQKDPLPLISPDGGETVYEQNRDGTRGKLISQTQLARDNELPDVTSSMFQ